MTGGTGGLRFARPALFLALLTSSAAAAPLDDALAKASAQKTWEKPGWIRLGHWKPNRWTPGLASDAEVKGFFLAPTAVTDPRAELEAELRAFYTDGPGPEPQPARCRFPARAAWLTSELGLTGLPPADCSKYLDWKKLLDPGSATLIFASAYLNNPASMFGHTFLRLERAKLSDRLLDNTLNFAAETGDDGGALFAVKGLLGLYPGQYTVRPYYMMVQTYNNIESRDLWEYKLSLPPEQVDTLAAHAWEMGQATFPYYFFSKNCSYQLMPALEAAAPERTLMKGSPPVVGPVDTLHAVLASPGLVAAVNYRPSHSTTMRQRRSLLSKEEREAADAYRLGKAEKGDALSKDMPPERRALVLDAAQDYVLYKEGYSPDVPLDVRERERQILTRRAKIDAPPVEPPAPAWALPPDEGHRRKRLAFGAGARNGGAFGELSWRPGYHDLLDRPQGYVPGAQIYGLSWRLRYDGAEERVYVRDLRLVEVLSAGPFDPWMKKPAWSLGTGLDTAFEKGRRASDSLVYDGHLGTGAATELGPVSGFVLLGGEGLAGAVLDKGYRIAGLVRGGLTADLSPKWRVAVEGALSATWFGDQSANHRLKVGLNWAPTRDRALRAEYFMRGPHREGGLYAVLYH